MYIDGPLKREFYTTLALNEMLLVLEMDTIVMMNMDVDVKRVERSNNLVEQ